MAYYSGEQRPDDRGNQHLSAQHTHLAHPQPPQPQQPLKPRVEIDWGPVMEDGRGGGGGGGGVGGGGGGAGGGRGMEHDELLARRQEAYESQNSKLINAVPLAPHAASHYQHDLHPYHPHPQKQQQQQQQQQLHANSQPHQPHPQQHPQHPQQQQRGGGGAGRAGAPEDTFPGLYDRSQQSKMRNSVDGPGLVLGQVCNAYAVGDRCIVTCDSCMYHMYSMLRKV